MNEQDHLLLQVRETKYTVPVELQLFTKFVPWDLVQTFRTMRTTFFFFDVFCLHFLISVFFSGSSPRICCASSMKQKLVGGLKHVFYFSIHWEVTLSQLTNKHLFQRGFVAQPPTSYGIFICWLTIINHNWPSLTITNHY